MIYQSPDTALNPRQRVRDVIGRPLEFYLGLRGQALDRRIGELLELIELDEKLRRPLPGRTVRRAEAAHLHRPGAGGRAELIICDEVTSALDQIVQEEILKLLMKLQGESNVTYLFITHDIATVRAIADEIVVMYQGQVVQQGPKSKVLTPPHPAYTELLLSSVPEMDPDWLSNLLAKRSAASAGRKAASNLQPSA